MLVIAGIGKHGKFTTSIFTSILPIAISDVARASFKIEPHLHSGFGAYGFVTG